MVRLSFHYFVLYVLLNQRKNLMIRSHLGPNYKSSNQNVWFNKKKINHHYYPLQKRNKGGQEIFLQGPL